MGGPWREAIRHQRSQKPGFDILITHEFVVGDPYLDSAAVFGVRTSCLGDYVRHEAGRAPEGRRLDRAFYTLDARFALAAL